MKIENIIIYIIADGKPCLLRTSGMDNDVLMTYLSAANKGETLELIPVKNAQVSEFNTEDIDIDFVKERERERS